MLTGTYASVDSPSLALLLSLKSPTILEMVRTLGHCHTQGSERDRKWKSDIVRKTLMVKTKHDHDLCIPKLSR